MSNHSKVKLHTQHIEIVPNKKLHVDHAMLATLCHRKKLTLQLYAIKIAFYDDYDDDNDDDDDDDDDDSQFSIAIVVILEAHMTSRDLEQFLSASLYVSKRGAY